MIMSTDVVGRRLRPRYHQLCRAMSGGQPWSRRRRYPMPPLLSPTIRRPRALPEGGRVAQQNAMSGKD